MASNYYVSHSTPSPHHSKSNPASGAGTPAPQPLPRALVFLTSEQTRKGLAGVHAVSGQAVKVSTKTVTAVDNMIRRAMGSKPKQRRFLPPEPPSNIPGAGPSYPTYPTDKGPVGPPMHPRASSFGGSNSYLTAPPAYPGPPPPLGAYPGDNKPPVPPRARSTSPGLPPMPPPTMQGPPPGSTGGFLPPQPGPRPPLSTRERVVLSADLILSTIDHETRRILNGGTETIGHVVGHKYGPEAAESSVLMAGTAKNVALVYVDMRGMGRRALLRAAGTQFVKGQLSGNPPPLPKR
ncbi:hypothetical protein H0H81_009059 [Sphagnurus paluster]|uniref:Senescence domain-containing protein n=1 Tax=Sphagnurus paluster TaxID=117069 RepID=A0A9P7GSX6_9AGAR|nr:hypothetical protein H0H81_009059 [Sphagnurus paluster]